jgi:hypothetical protein
MGHTSYQVLGAVWPGGALWLMVGAFACSSCTSAQVAPPTNSATSPNSAVVTQTAGSALGASGNGRLAAGSDGPQVSGPAGRPAAGGSAGMAASSRGAAAGSGGVPAAPGQRPPTGGSTSSAGSNAGTTTNANGPAPGTATAENSGASCMLAELPAYAGLSANPKLPDPFKSLDGVRISSKQQWTCRRAEIVAQAQQYELGPKPGKPETVTGKSSGNALEVTATQAGKSISFSARIMLPSTGKAPYPALIGVGGVSLNSAAISQLGVAIVSFDNNDIAQQNDASSRGKGKFYDLYGSNHGAGAMMAWAWAVSRLIDAIETTPAANIDPRHIGVTGCSRNGKGALIVGAFDERIALTIAQESGSGGSAAWRVSDAQHSAGQNVQTLSEITGENCWFRGSFNQFNNTATRLPFDHHELMGLVAPRGLLVIENTSMEWLGNLSCYTCATVAHEIWDALGVKDNMGVSQVGNHNHCAFPASQQPEVTAYIRKFLLDDASAATSIMKTDGTFTVDKAQWLDWTTPSLP